MRGAGCPQTHPLFGRVLQAVAFTHLSGVLHLVVELPDGSPGTIRAAATDIVEEERVGEPAVFDVEGLRALRVLVTRLSGFPPK